MHCTGCGKEFELTYIPHEVEVLGITFSVCSACWNLIESYKDTDLYENAKLYIGGLINADGAGLPYVVHEDGSFTVLTYCEASAAGLL